MDNQEKALSLRNWWIISSYSEKFSEITHPFFFTNQHDEFQMTIYAKLQMRCLTNFVNVVKGGTSDVTGDIPISREREKHEKQIK